MKISRSRKSTVGIMKNGGTWGEVKIIQHGERRLSVIEQATMTLAEAMELWMTKGIPVTVQ